MSEYNRENHHDDHHDDITRFRAERDAALAELAAQLAKNDRLREERRKGVAELAHLRVAVDRLRDDLDEQNAELAQMREEMTKEADEAARLREDNRNLWQKRNDLVQEVGDLRAKLATLSEGHRICEANMDAEIDRLREALETIANSKGQSPEVDASECRVIARTALKEKGLFKTDRNGVGPEDPRFYDA